MSAVQALDELRAPADRRQAIIITVPWDSGRHNERMGAGPDAILARGLAGAIGGGRPVPQREVNLPTGKWNAEIDSAFLIARRVSDEVRQAADEGALPIVLSGNCGVAAGIVSGLRRTPAFADADPSLVWCDAHGDVHTPDTTRSGFLDGMALSIVLGRCWRPMTKAIPGFRALPTSRVVHVGARDFDEGELEILVDSAAHVIAPFPATSRASDVMGSAVAALRNGSDNGHRKREAYLHIDLDVLDTTEGRANSYAAPGGLSAGSLIELVELVREELGIAALALTAYDPSGDPEGRIADIAMLVARAALDQR